MSQTNKPAGIKEIAEALGISIGTVDRALNNRGRISSTTRAKVLEMASRLGYRPNLTARFLSSRRELRIAVCLPREVASFFDLVRAGIETAAAPFETAGVRLVPYFYPRLGQRETDAVRRALDAGADGLILTPGQPEKLKPLLADAKQRNIPAVCVTTDAPDTDRLATVSVDPVTSGALAGELMGRFLHGEGHVLLVTGQLDTMDHAGKVQGFRQAVDRIWPRLRIATPVEAHDDEAEAYAKCRKVLAQQRNVNGLYVSTANSIPVLTAVQDLGLGDRLTIMTTDLFPALVPFIESGRVAATLYQRPRRQGQLAFHTLYRYLVEGVLPTTHERLAPHLVVRTNLQLFLDRERAGVGEPAGDAGGDAEPATPASAVRRSSTVNART